MLLKVAADVEHRLPDEARLPEEQRDDHAPEAAVAVQEGVERLELGVKNSQLDEPVGLFRVQVRFPARERLRELVCADRHVGRLLHRAAGRTDPDRRATELPWGLVLPAHAVQQHGVGLADDATRQRQLRQRLGGGPHGATVVEDLVDVLAPLGCGRRLPRLELEHLDHGRLSALDA